jgi:hypothetical protein
MGPNLRIDFDTDGVWVELKYQGKTYGGSFACALDAGEVEGVVLNKSQFNFIDGLSDLAERWLSHIGK